MHDRPYSLERARAFIASVAWTFAKTRATNSHWYIRQIDVAGVEFDAFVAAIRATPIRRWHGGRFHCLTVVDASGDSFDYWCTWVHPGGWIIVNRKPSATAGWDPFPPSHDFRDRVLHDYEHGPRRRAPPRAALPRPRRLGALMASVWWSVRTTRRGEKRYKGRVPARRPRGASSRGGSFPTQREADPPRGSRASWPRGTSPTSLRCAGTRGSTVDEAAEPLAREPDRRRRGDASGTGSS